MELEDDKKNKNYNKYVIPLALMKQEEMKETMFHWKIVITKSYPFEPPKIFNLDGIHHPEIDQLTGQAKMDFIDKKWSPVLTLKSIIYALKLFLIGALEEFEPQEMLYRDSKNKASGEYTSRSDYDMDFIKLDKNNSRKRKFADLGIIQDPFLLDSHSEINCYLGKRSKLEQSDEEEIIISFAKKVKISSELEINRHKH